MFNYLARRRGFHTPSTPLNPARFLLILLALVAISAGCGSTDEAESAAERDEQTDQADGGDNDRDDGDQHEAGMEMEDDDADGHDHGDEEMIEVPGTMTVPTLAISTAADPSEGVNLSISVEDYTFAPEHASTDPIDGEGHVHIYIDGEKLGRFYNHGVHLSALGALALEPGEHEVMVEVSANNHLPYAVDGVPITQSETITIEAAESTGDEPASIEIDAAPAIEIEVLTDPKAGWNVHFDVSDFDLVAPMVTAAAAEGEGHLVLSVDGQPLTRLYGSWWHLSGLSNGEHELTAQLVASDRSPFTVDGEPIVATTVITVGDDSNDSAAAGTEADIIIKATVAGDEVTIDNDRQEIELGSLVSVQVTSDANDHIHLHGYDLLTDVAADELAEFDFVADIPGVFEVELEEAGTLLFEIAVS